MGRSRRAPTSRRSTTRTIAALGDRTVSVRARAGGSVGRAERASGAALRAADHARPVADRRPPGARAARRRAERRRPARQRAGGPAAVELRPRRLLRGPLLLLARRAGRSCSTRCEELMPRGGTLLAVSWRGRGTHQLAGDEVHEELRRRERLVRDARGDDRGLPARRAMSGAERVVIVGGGPAGAGRGTRLPRGGRDRRRPARHRRRPPAVPPAAADQGVPRAARSPRRTLALEPGRGRRVVLAPAARLDAPRRGWSS